MAQPQAPAQPADASTQPAPRRRRPRTPTWMQRPPVVVCAVLLVVVAELAVYALLGWLWWLIVNVALVVVLWCGALAWRRKGKGGLLDRILGALFSGRTGTTSRTSKASRAGGKGGPLLRLLGGGRGKGAGSGSGKSGRGLLGGGRGKSASGGSTAGKAGTLGRLLGGGKGAGEKGRKPGRGSKSGGSGSALGQLGDALGLGKSAKNKTGKAGKGSKGGGGKSGQPWWRTLWDQGKAGIEAAKEDDAERQRRRADKRAQRAEDDDQDDEDVEPSDGANTRRSPAPFAQLPLARQSKGEKMYTDGASLYRFGRNLPQVSEAIQEHAAEARKHEGGLAETVKALQKLAAQADTELPADKAIVAEIESIRARAAALLSDPQSAKLARLAAEAEDLPRRYQAAHSEDEARLAGRRGGVAAEKRADVAAGEADT